MASQSAVVPKDTVVGFIGAGRMCQALSQGFSSCGLIQPSNMIASDVDDNMLKFIAATGIKTTTDNKEVVKTSSIIFIAVKPHIVHPVLQELAPLLTKDHLIVSIAAGITLSALQEPLPTGIRVVRVMPNTPALVSCGASVYALGSAATEEDGKVVAALLASVGICEKVPEYLVDSVTGVSGSGPAYVFIAIEALADGGVKMGLPRDLAQKLAAQTLMGASKMVLETGKHPGELKDAVCSPGGTTIAGVHQLEKGGFRSSLINAVEAAVNKCKELGN